MSTPSLDDGLDAVQADTVAQLALAEIFYAQRHRSVVEFLSVVERGGPVSPDEADKFIDEIGDELPGVATALVRYAVVHFAHVTEGDGG